MGRSTLQGFPAATVLGGIFFVTTAPDPMTQLSPIVTPGLTITPPPNQTLFPIVIGDPNSKPDTLTCASIGCDAVVIRHPKENYYEDLIERIKIPVVSGGDGTGNHPSQTSNIMQSKLA